MFTSCNSSNPCLEKTPCHGLPNLNQQLEPEPYPYTWPCPYSQWQSQPTCASMLDLVPDPALDDTSQQREKMYIKEQDETMRMCNNGYGGHEDGSFEYNYNFI